jgi:hypothetical protein
MTFTKSTSNNSSSAYVAVPKDQVEPFLAENKGRKNSWWKAQPKVFLVLLTLAFAMGVFHLVFCVGARSKYKVTKAAASDGIEVVMPWNGRPARVSHHGAKDTKASSSSSSDDEKEGWFSDWEWPWESSDSSSSDSSSNDSSSLDSSSGDSSDSSSGDSSSPDSSSSDETSPNTVDVEPKD